MSLRKHTVPFGHCVDYLRGLFWKHTLTIASYCLQHLRSSKKFVRRLFLITKEIGLQPFYTSILRDFVVYSFVYIVSK